MDAQNERSPEAYRVFGRVQRWKGPETLAMALRLLGSAALPCEWYGRDVDHGVRGQPTSAMLSTNYPEVMGKTFLLKAPVAQREVHALQASALCNIVPSLWDVFNFTAVEAMASGRPVICSRGAGASELIVDGISGFLFDAGDPKGLARAMQQVQEMAPSERADMGRRARAHVLQRLDPDQNAALRIQEYEKLIAAFQPGSLPESIQASVAPEQPGTPVHSWAPLDLLPARALSEHLAKRVLARVTGWRQA
jgi:glycosyltransferase involved in cell wall biosynthesis